MPLFQPPAMPEADVQPSDHGFKLWSCDPSVCANSTIATAGLLHGVRIWNHANLSVSVASATVYVAAAGATLTNVGFGLWSAAGALLTSSVNANGATAAVFQTTGQKGVTFTAQTLAPGASLYVGFWFTGTTMPTLQRAGATPAMNNIGLLAPNFRYFTANTGLTTTAPATLGTQTSAPVAYWVATA